MTLHLPLTGKSNRPIYDSAGKLVSIVEHAGMFAAALNFTHALAAMDPADLQADPLAVLVGLHEKARSIVGADNA